MKKLVAAAIAVLTIAPSAFATDYAVFLHGRKEATWNGGFRVPAGFTAVDAATDWNGTASITNINYAGYAALCASPNRCIVNNYSTGGLITQRMQLLKAANPMRTFSAASAGGGSELADACGWITQWSCYYGGVDDNLKPTWARNGGNSLQSTRGNTSYHIAGNGWSWLSVATSGVINGDDDSAVGPHSSTGCDSSKSFGLGTDCRYDTSCAKRNWVGWCTSYNRAGARKSGHSQWVTGGWTHFNIAQEAPNRSF